MHKDGAALPGMVDDRGADIAHLVVGQLTGLESAPELNLEQRLLSECGENADRADPRRPVRAIVGRLAAERDQLRDSIGIDIENVQPELTAQDGPGDSSAHVPRADDPDLLLVQAARHSPAHLVRSFVEWSFRLI